MVAMWSTVVKTTLKSYFFGVRGTIWWDEYLAFLASILAPPGQGHKWGQTRGNTRLVLEQCQGREIIRPLIHLRPSGTLKDFPKLTLLSQKARQHQQGMLLFSLHSPLEQSNVLLMVFMCSNASGPSLQHELDKTIAQPTTRENLKTKSFLRKNSWNRDTFKMARCFWTLAWEEKKISDRGEVSGHLSTQNSFHCKPMPVKLKISLRWTI